MKKKIKEKDFLGTNTFIEIYDQFKNVKEIGEVIPGYYLGYDSNKNGYYLVGGQGKPGDELLFIPKNKLLFDPMRYLSDRQINNLKNDDPIVKADRIFCDNLLDLEKIFIFDIHTSIQLYEACKKSGFKKQISIVVWILNKIEDLINTKS